MEIDGSCRLAGISEKWLVDCCLFICNGDDNEKNS